MYRLEIKLDISDLIQALWWGGANLYSFRAAANMRLLLCVGIKVVDEWQISLGYVRGR